MKRHIGLVLLLIVVATSMSRTEVVAAGCCCAHCGCDAPCRKVCRLESEEKKVEVVCWGCKCDEFCVPGPSKPGCEHCRVVCNTCGDEESKDIHVCPKRFVWTNWIPRHCATIHTKIKLMKGVTTVTVPGHKWVVEDLCPECVADCKQMKLAPGAEVPPPPQVAADVTLFVPTIAFASHEQQSAQE